MNVLIYYEFIEIYVRYENYLPIRGDYNTISRI